VKWRKRIERIRRARRDGTTFYRLRDGSVKGIRDRHVFDAFLEAARGTDTPRAQVMLTAVAMLTPKGGRLHELVQSLAIDLETPTQTEDVIQ